MAQNPLKIREIRLRRMAVRQGLELHKSRRRDPRALDFGLYSLIDTRGRGRTVLETKVLDDIERHLTGGNDA